MIIKRLVYTRSKSVDFRMMYGSKEIDNIDKNNIYGDYYYGVFTCKNNLLSHNHLFVRSVSDNRYALYKLFEAGKDNCGKEYYALFGFIIGADGVRSLPYVLVENLYNLKYFDKRTAKKKITDKTEDKTEDFEYNLNPAVEFCINKKEILKQICDFINIEPAVMNFILEEVSENIIKIEPLE